MIIMFWERGRVPFKFRGMTRGAISGNPYGCVIRILSTGEFIEMAAYTFWRSIGEGCGQMTLATCRNIMPEGEWKETMID
jgi:hypothetical protein